MSDLSRRPEIPEVLGRSAAVVGAAATGGPAGAGVALAVQVAQSALERAKRERFAGAPLAELQQARVEEAYEEAKRVIAAQITTHGRTPRTDWFGDPLHDYVPAAETLELTLIAAAESYERRKVKLLANILGLLAFEPGVSHGAGLYLIRTARELSYRQLVALAAICEMSEGPPSAKAAELAFVVSSSNPLLRFGALGPEAGAAHVVSSSLAGEVLDLTHRDLLRQGGSKALLVNRWGVRASQLRPSVAGRRLYALCALGVHVTPEARQEMADELLRARDPSRDGVRPQP